MVEESEQNDENVDGGSNIKLSTPWGGEQNICLNSYANRCHISDSTDVSPNHFITERTRLHEVYIREQAKSKRVGIVLAFLLILSASLILLFAPNGREVQSYWIGAALIIFAAGSVGFGRVWGKAASISFGADQDKRDLDK